MLCIKFQSSGPVFWSVTDENVPRHRNEREWFFGVTILEEVMCYVIMDPSLQREAQISEPFCVSV
jgi:hypothetical protein